MEGTDPDWISFLISSQVITHDKMLENCEDNIEFFLRRISLMKDKLGVLLLQLPTLRTEHLALLSNFLAILPKDYRFSVEVRNKELLQHELYSLLRNYNVALAVAEHPFWAKHEILTADFAYIRWEGDRRKVKGTMGQVEVNKTTNIAECANKIKNLLDGQIERAYYSGHPPTDAKQLLDILSI